MTTEYQQGWACCIAEGRRIAAERSGISDRPAQLAMLDLLDKLVARAPRTARPAQASLFPAMGDAA